MLTDKWFQRPRNFGNKAVSRQNVMVLGDDIIKMWKVYKVTEILKMIVAVSLYYFFTFGQIDRWA